MCDILTEQLQHYTVLWRETSALYEEWAKRHALSYYELLVILSIMNPDGPCLQKDICTHWQLPKQTVNPILKNFAGRGWITLVPSAEDRRGRVILPTGTGRLFMEATVSDLQAHEKSVWQRMGQENARALLESTALYNKLFKETDSNETA